MRILIFGAPGVGKGTQAKILAAKLEIPHISTGDMLRDAISNKTEFGLKAKSYMDNGDLVPDEIIAGIIKERLSEEDCERGFILDGIPRTTVQAELLDRIFKSKKCGNLFLIILNAEEDILIKRLSNRRLCSVCGNIVNLNDLENSNMCPYCNSVNSFIKRKDDNDDVIINRLKVYEKLTTPVLDYYKEKARNIIIDGTQPIELVTNEILEKLQSD